MSTPSKTRSPGAIERAASVAVFAVLLAVLAWILVRQAQFDPAVLVAATAAQQAGKTTAAAAAPRDLLDHWPAGLRPISAAEDFTPSTLSDKIDGKAELYFSSGFVAMRCQRVALSAEPDAWMEVFIYDMGGPENAFSVYSSQKRHELEEVNIGDYGYRAGNQLCFVHGKYYAEIVAAEARSATMDAARILAQSFVAATAVGRHADVTQDQSLFPKEGQIAGSVMLLGADVFGFNQLKDVFVAHYQDGGDEVTLFLSRRSDPAAAADIASALKVFFVRDCGGKETPPPAAPAGAAIIDAGGSFNGVFASGSVLAGVHEAPSREAVERWMIRLNRSLEQAKP